MVAFTILPGRNVRAGARFYDDMEAYLTTSHLAKAYTVWSSGAETDVALTSSTVLSGQKAMRVTLSGPNPTNGSINGSIYHNLHIASRNWGNAQAIRFWIDNAGQDALRMNLNIKEQYSEYWAVGEQGPYFLQNQAGDLTQLDVRHNNIDIPAGYQGYVIVPFVSFSVPAWNTAIGDAVLDLGQIESFAIGMVLPAKVPHTFTIDDLEVLVEAPATILNISGQPSVSVPGSGTHVETYSATYAGLDGAEITSQSVTWSILSSHDPAITFDDQGRLSVPAGTASGDVVLQAETGQPGNRITRTYRVSIYGAEPMPASMQPAASLAPAPEPNPYDQFSQSFEVWALQNRPVFVVAIIAVLMLVVFVLSRVERGIR